MNERLDVRIISRTLGQLDEEVFERLPTFRQTLLQRAGRFTYPGGRCTLIVARETAVRDRLMNCLERLSETSNAA